MSGNKIKVNTSEYEFIHGRQPGGGGKRLWFFILEGGPESGTTISYHGNYDEALKIAKKEAINIKAHTVVVGS